MVNQVEFMLAHQVSNANKLQPAASPSPPPRYSTRHTHRGILAAAYLTWHTRRGILDAAYLTRSIQFSILGLAYSPRYTRRGLLGAAYSAQRVRCCIAEFREPVGRPIKPRPILPPSTFTPTKRATPARTNAHAHDADCTL